MSEAYNYLDHTTAYSSCANACEHCASVCLSEGNAEHYRCVELCEECVQHVNAHCQECARTCQVCAEEPLLEPA